MGVPFSCQSGAELPAWFLFSEHAHIGTAVAVADAVTLVGDIPDARPKRFGATLRLCVGTPRRTAARGSGRGRRTTHRPAPAKPQAIAGPTLHPWEPPHTSPYRPFCPIYGRRCLAGAVAHSPERSAAAGLVRRPIGCSVFGAATLLGPPWYEQAT